MEREEREHSLPIGTILNDKWIILEFIAKGGMGEIYRAHQLNLKRDVAIKTVSKTWLKDIEDDEEEKENALKRFKQEVLTMAQIRHPNVIQIYDFDSANIKIDNGEINIDYIALEYIPGRTLRDTMREEGFYPSQKKTIDWIKNYFFQVLDGISALHQTGVIHRDIKPENVLLDGKIPKIADFGLARSCKFESMTCSLEIKGTPTYMAPEQFIDFKGVDERTDIYALDKILYEAIAGKIPENAVPFTQVELKEPASDFFKKINKIIKKATDKDPQNRFVSVNEFKEALEQLLQEEEKQKQAEEKPSKGQIQMSKKALVALATVALIILVALSFWLFHYVQEHFFTPKTQIAKRTIRLPLDIPPTIEATDGTTMQLIPEGEILIPAGFDGRGPKVVKIKAFYMDKTPVTNQQFVEFLNKIKDSLTVENGAVKKDDKIYLYLGEALQGYEPIIFSNGSFKVKHPGHSACPVIRVTGFGALAYANFYDKRLPTKVEWLYVAGEGGSSLEKFPKSFFEPIKLPYPVMLLKENALGIKGMNLHLGSWCLDSLTTKNSVSTDEFTIMGGFEPIEHNREEALLAVKRKPWEAFEEVGFRCVRELNYKRN